jgi:hypothetical protein
LPSPGERRSVDRSRIVWGESGIVFEIRECPISAGNQTTIST